MQTILSEWFHKRPTIILGVLVVFMVVSVLIPSTLFRQSRRLVTRSIQTDTQGVDVLWVRGDILASPISTTQNGSLFAVSTDGDRLIAIDVQSGRTQWDIRHASTQERVRHLLVDGQTLLAITTTGVDAYELANGKSVWSTDLGTGHVSIMAQLEGSILRVYYGDRIFELDVHTGRVLKNEQKGATVWVVDGLRLALSPSGLLTALDRVGGNQVWSGKQAFYIDEPQKPVSLNDVTLLVGRNSAGHSGYIDGLCALDLRTGVYSWCRKGIYISQIVPNEEASVGYIIREDFSLLSIDLTDGSVRSQVGFAPSTLPDDLVSALWSYSVAASNGVIIVAFEDSAQTFALVHH